MGKVRFLAFKSFSSAFASPTRIQPDDALSTCSFVPRPHHRDHGHAAMGMPPDINGPEHGSAVGGVEQLMASNPDGAASGTFRNAWESETAALAFRDPIMASAFPNNTLDPRSSPDIRVSRRLEHPGSNIQGRGPASGTSRSGSHATLSRGGVSHTASPRFQHASYGRSEGEGNILATSTCCNSGNSMSIARTRMKLFLSTTYLSTGPMPGLERNTCQLLSERRWRTCASFVSSYANFLRDQRPWLSSPSAGDLPIPTGYGGPTTCQPRRTRTILSGDRISEPTTIPVKKRAAGASP
jgi:hypothetical protein